MKSERRWCAGRDGIRSRRRWRCGRGSCWPARTAGRTPRAPPSRLRQGHGRQVAPPVRRRPAGRAGRRTEAWRGAHDQRRGRRGRRGRDAGDHTRGRHTLVDSVDGPAARDLQDTVSEIWRAFGLKPWQKTVQDVARSGPDREDPRPGRRCTCPHRSRPRSTPSTRSRRSKRSTGTAPILPMLPTTPQQATHDYVRYGTWTCSPPWRSPPAPSSPTCASATPRRLHRVLEQDRPRGPRRPRRTRHPRQPLHP